MKQFNWQMADVMEIAKQIKEKGKGNMRGQILHYKEADNEVMLNRILLAKKIAEMWEYEDKAESIRKELVLKGVFNEG